MFAHQHWRACAFVFVLIGALALASAASARPKVCLVLSGGGARGAAHIGVLQEIERMRIPVDCIAGTSMGALVGGAYAAGMTTVEMQRLIADISTATLIREAPPRQEQTVRRKLDDRSLLVGPELGLTDDWDVRLSKGVISGVGLEVILRRLAYLAGERKFDRLPIPFRSVATDLVTGKQVVFAHGELASAMRASMSIPGVIAPAEIDGRLLVDGGLTNNLPVDVARSMGADVVIAVNLGTPLMKREEIVSLRGVTAQMINILTEQNVQASLASLKPTDILIEPELGRFSASDFEEMPKTVPIGVEAVRRVADRVAALALSPTDYAQLRAHQHEALPADTRPLAEIRFRPMERVSAAALDALLETHTGAPLDYDALDRDMRRLYGTGDFEHVGYRVLDEEGRRVVQIEAVEKSWGPNYLRFGLGLGADLHGETFFNVAASYRRTWVNSLGAEWRTDLQLGNTNRLMSEFYQPLETRRYFFVAPRIDVERRNFDVFSGADRIARYDVRTTDVALDLGTALTRYGELRVGVLSGGLKYSLDTGPQSLAPPTSRVNRGAFTVRAIFDQLDSADFPRAGLAASAHIFNSSRSLGADDAYAKWDADMLGAVSAGRHTLHFAAKAGGALSGSLPPYDLFQWGGFLHQSGYPMGALLGERLTFGRVGYAYKILDQKLFEGLYAGVSLEAGQMAKPLVAGSNTGWLKSSAVYVGMDTIVGPLYLGYGWAADGNRSAYLYLGRP